MHIGFASMHPTVARVTAAWYPGGVPNYRRYAVPGGTFFFTVNLADRSSRLLVERIDLFRAAYRETRARHPFATQALCVLPNHLHAVWRLPEGDTDDRTRWRPIKMGFTRALPDAPAGRRPGERGVWQRRFYERYLRDDAMRDAAIRYTHGNPVRHGLAPDADTWPHATWHDCQRTKGPASLIP